MDELSLHILDIVQNSIYAKATFIEIKIVDDSKSDTIIIEIKDNGVGIEETKIDKIQDPFYTTKEGKRVGLGIPLFKQTAVSCDGEFYIESKKNMGTKIFAKFRKSHPDLPPLGDLKSTIFTILSINSCDFKILYYKDKKGFEIDTREIKEYLGGIPINNPKVIGFLKNYLDEKFKQMEVNSET